jgi:hypothetical protein
MAFNQQAKVPTFAQCPFKRKSTPRFVPIVDPFILASTPQNLVPFRLFTLSSRCGILFPEIPRTVQSDHLHLTHGDYLKRAIIEHLPNDTPRWKVNKYKEKYAFR